MNIQVAEVRKSQHLTESKVHKSTQVENDSKVTTVFQFDEYDKNVQNDRE